MERSELWKHLLHSEKRLKELYEKQDDLIYAVLAFAAYNAKWARDAWESAAINIAISYVLSEKLTSVELKKLPGRLEKLADQNLPALLEIQRQKNALQLGKSSKKIIKEVTKLSYDDSRYRAISGKLKKYEELLNERLEELKPKELTSIKKHSTTLQQQFQSQTPGLQKFAEQLEQPHAKAAIESFRKYINKTLNNKQKD